MGACVRKPPKGTERASRREGCSLMLGEGQARRGVGARGGQGLSVRLLSLAGSWGCGAG